MLNDGDHQTIFRIDRFVVPVSSEAEFLAAVTETNTAFDGLEGCVQKHVLKQDGVPGDSTYMTVVEWDSLAAFQNAHKVMAAKHKEMNLNPQELFSRPHIKAELGNFLPLPGGRRKRPSRFADSRARGAR